MFGPKHYVPILRWKQAERLALRYLRKEDRERITPLIEITPKIFEAPKEGKKEGKNPDPAGVLPDHAKQLQPVAPDSVTLASELSAEPINEEPVFICIADEKMVSGRGHLPRHS